MKTRGQEKWKITTTEMMLRGILEVSRLEHIRNLPPVDEIMRSGRMRWFAHVQRPEENNVARRAMNVALPVVRLRERQRKAWKQQIKEDTRDVDMTLDRPYPYVQQVGLVFPLHADLS